MPSHTLPGDDFPDPLSLLRDAQWEDNWPVIILRGIYDVMRRERKAGSGSLMESYIKAFNVIFFSMAITADPKRVIVDGGNVVLTPYGRKRDEMVRGLRQLDTEAKRRYGNKSRAEMQKDTKKKLKELRLWLDMLKHELPDPVQSPNASSLVL